MALEAKQVSCQCGHSFSTEKEKTYCEKCARPVFYHKKDQRRNTLNHYYAVAMAALVITFLTYLFIEMIATPLLHWA